MLVPDTTLPSTASCNHQGITAMPWAAKKRCKAQGNTRPILETVMNTSRCMFSAYVPHFCADDDLGRTTRIPRLPKVSLLDTDQPGSECSDTIGQAPNNPEVSLIYQRESDKYWCTSSSLNQYWYSFGKVTLISPYTATALTNTRLLCMNTPHEYAPSILERIARIGDVFLFSRHG